MAQARLERTPMTQAGPQVSVAREGDAVVQGALPPREPGRELSPVAMPPG